MPPHDAKLTAPSNIVGHIVGNVLGNIKLLGNISFRATSIIGQHKIIGQHNIIGQNKIIGQHKFIGQHKIIGQHQIIGQHTIIGQHQISGQHNGQIAGSIVGKSWATFGATWRRNCWQLETFNTVQHFVYPKAHKGEQLTSQSTKKRACSPNWV